MNNNIPDGFPLMSFVGVDYFAPMEQFKTIINLRHSLFDKLIAIPKLTHTLRANIKDLFSGEDISILNNLLLDNRINNESKAFISKIINENLVLHNDAPKRKIDHILSFADLKNMYPQKTYKTFSKWFSLSNEVNLNGIRFNTLKVNTILNGEIYLAQPTEFNDIFDCQLHLNDLEILKFADDDVSNIPMARQVEILAKYSANICSFSLNTPTETNSNHMWGYYGSCGSGFVITYDLDHLIKLAVDNFNSATQDKSAKQDKFLFFEPTIYKDIYNPGIIFKKCLDEYFGKKNKTALPNFFKEFTNTKTKQWEYEKEFRIHNLSLDKFKSLSDRSNWDTIEHCKHSEDILKRTTSSHSIKFITPIQITLGWSCNTSDDDIKRILSYAKNNAIKIYQLEKYINYKTGEFYQHQIIS